MKEHNADLNQHPEIKVPPTEKELIKEFADLYADRLLYRQLWRNAELEDHQLVKWDAIEADLLRLTLQTLPRIHSQELTRISLLASPIDTQFYLALPGRIRISIGRKEIEENNPDLALILPPILAPITPKL